MKRDFSQAVQWNTIWDNCVVAFTTRNNVMSWHVRIVINTSYSTLIFLPPKRKGKNA